ncbi:membrane protein [Actinoplanes sp. NBRC 14428]|nr:membrane protein [Actinoplanes sp. NBRC 14428]
MDLSDTGTTVTVIAGIAMLAGVLGVVIPVLPGLLLCWAAVLFWALLGDASGGRWVVLALATLVALGGTVVKYLWPGRRLKSTGVPTSSMLAGGVLGVIGFFVVPVVGLVLGFVLGLFLAERLRLGPGQAWPSTRQALGAVGLSLLVEFAAALAIAVIWVFGLIAT